ncbi:hypothetical protein JX265_000465 [Neoarthrinium moseri]|uniref:Uncharacterized protein n=1 Tax=Neoarthrinium moseri TaxID=1658444 RepID=A0A9P9WYT8_9PEZI|nr:uncharacterized protein JN550_000715 [Neoarthrinium moseri]KAI1851301.1 hypothetical protein JX266_003376 [Neoarthrinium moseri]KAI1878533.1 hypothetical protein JN550_000715 [Neoarthrinium moseri]KAI1881639.1 hypothetical protein JX265_000465 [Neoarthrinium moseri]
MADSASRVEQTPLKPQQPGQAQSILNQQTSNLDVTSQSDNGGNAEAPSEAVKDQIDDAVAKGPKKADQYSGGRVSVAETGDLHDLAARRQSEAHK